MHGAETIDAEIVLREMPGDLGVLLWKTVRSVRLRAEIARRGSAPAFARESHEGRLALLAATRVPEAIEDALRMAAEVLRPGHRASRVANACREVAEWAAEESGIGTAVEFMQAAAVTMPADARLAHEVARLARLHAEYPRAETWYRQAVSRARRASDWYDFSRSYLGLGSVALHRGNYPQAKKNIIRALRAARRFGLRPLVGAAYHELAVVAVQTEQPRELARYASAALEAYGPAHPRLPALAFDCGVFLLGRGFFAEALRIFRTIPREYGTPGDRLLRAAAVVRAAAGAGDATTYRSAWSEAQELLGDPSAASAAATALLSLAHGARTANDLGRAEEAAARVQTLATARDEAQLQFEAAELLESVRSGRRAAASQGAAKAPPRNLVGLVEELESALREAGSL